MAGRRLAVAGASREGDDGGKPDDSADGEEGAENRPETNFHSLSIIPNRPRWAEMCDDHPVKSRSEKSLAGVSRRRIYVMAAAGLVVGLGVGWWGQWSYAAIAGWGVACIVYLSWVWHAIGGLDADETRRHATREDPTRGTSDTMIVIASLASLVALVFVLAQAQAAPGYVKAILAALAVASVVLSWLLVHTLFTLRYALDYYSDEPGGIDFNQDAPPRYADFAYVAFTLGMTFQVSDTNIQNSRIRVTVLRHSLLSYLFGSVILATTVNLIAGLAS